MPDLKKICVLLRKAGIGDILTLTPGLRELRRRFSKPCKIIVFVPSEETRQILLHNSDIDGVVVGVPPNKKQSTVIDITEYPALYESKIIPNVEKSRIELFNEALGGLPLKDTSIILNFTPQEIHWAKEFCSEYKDKLLIGIQPRSAEIYKDWPFKKFEALCELINKRIPNAVIFCFGKADDMRCPSGAIPIMKELRQQAAIVSHCHLLITIDSVLLHLGSIFQIPTLLILGPSGWRAKYQNVRVCQRTDTPCCPCWMNATMKCNPAKGRQRQTDGGFQNSLCLQNLSVEYIFDQFQLLFNSVLTGYLNGGIE